MPEYTFLENTADSVFYEDVEGEHEKNLILHLKLNLT